MICFQISIFEPLETTCLSCVRLHLWLWFAFKLVSLNHWKQLQILRKICQRVVICFQISIFEPLETTNLQMWKDTNLLWFAFKLVSLNHWKQQNWEEKVKRFVVICFQISIFEPLETTFQSISGIHALLWFAFKLVSLNHWKQLVPSRSFWKPVVICFQISIFEPLETTVLWMRLSWIWLWFAFKLVSLNHWKQQVVIRDRTDVGCDLLSN